MKSECKEVRKLTRQLPKLKSLLSKYRHLKMVQSSLLELSELASTVSDMESFYPALASVIQPLFLSENFHIVLENSWQELELSYCSDFDESISFAQFNHEDWLHTLTGSVYRSKKLLRCDFNAQDKMNQAEEITLVNNRIYQDWLGAPLVRGQNVIGVIAIQSLSDQVQYDDALQKLLTFISEYIVIAIDRVRSRELLEVNIQERTKKLTETNRKLQLEIAERQKSEKIHKALLRISAITASVDAETELFKSVHQVIKELMISDNFYVALYNAEKRELSFPYFVDELNPPPESRKLGQGLTEFILRLSKPALIRRGQVTIFEGDNQFTERPFNQRNNKSMKTKAWLGAPLIIHDNIIGIIATQSYKSEDAYQQSDLELMCFLSQHIAGAVHRNQTALQLRQHNEELEQQVSHRTKALQETNSHLRLQVEERRRAEERLYFEAHHDALTKLPNRTLFSDRLNQAIKHVKRHTTSRFAVLFIDLDRFKLINDTLGHQAGDEFLIEISHRILQCIRDNDIVARLGGDEFVILLDSLQDKDDAEEIACRIIEAIQQPFTIQAQELHSNASIGIAVCDQRYQNADELLRDADAAMYQAKAMGRGRYVFFDESMREQLLASLSLEQELRIAVSESQFTLYYQQIDDLKHESSIGFEACLRWQHPSNGLMLPGGFIQLAEETGLIIDIEHWVIQEAGKQLTKWKQNPDHANAFISINLSGKHLAQPANLNQLVSTIKAGVREPERLILEFTEKAFSQQNQDMVMRGLRKLKGLGVKLALDDYGAGLSSLNFLHNYPFEFIKLDRSFIQSAGKNDKNILLIQTLTQLGNQFGFRIVAEGIENEEMLNKLQAAGCEYGQGFYLGKPVAQSGININGGDDDVASCA